MPQGEASGNGERSGARWLATAQADLVRKAWKAPEGGRRTIGAYAEDYLARADLRESTRQLYEGVWRLHLRETWSSVAVADITPQQVRQWHEAAARTARPTALVQSYRLLRALLNVAVADQVLATTRAGCGPLGSQSPHGPPGR